MLKVLTKLVGAVFFPTVLSLAPVGLGWVDMSWRNMYSACNNLIEVDAADSPKPWNPQDCWCVGWPTLRSRSKNYEHCNVYVFLACRQLVTTFMCIAGGTSSLDQLFV
jgi:allantoicase